MPVEEWVLGPDHPRTLLTRAVLVGWTAEAVDPAAARDQLAGLLPVLEGVSGPDHPDTLVARAILAGCTGEAGAPTAIPSMATAALARID